MWTNDDRSDFDFFLYRGFEQKVDYAPIVDATGNKQGEFDLFAVSLFWGSAEICGRICFILTLRILMFLKIYLPSRTWLILNLMSFKST